MLNEYKNYLIINGKSKNTINSYISHISNLLKRVSLDNLTEKTINNYLLEIMENRSPSTMNICKSAIRSFLKFLKKDILIPKNEKIIEKLPEFITEDYFKKEVIPVIECVCKNPVKMKAILYFMFYSGLRISEIALLKRENINLEKRTIKFYIPKKKKERLGLIVGKKAKKFIEDYFSIEPEITNAFNISYHALKKRFADYNQYFKDINFHPHLLRHSFATHLRKNGMSIEDIKELMGHQNIQTTMRYAHVNIDDIKKRCDEKIK